ncbi:MAG: putative lipid II flippase FtsW [Gammaproteobacteria bacterium]
MTTTQAIPLGEARRRRATAASVRWDVPLALSVLALMCIGLVMVASASVTIADRQTGNPFYYLERQIVFIAIGIVISLPVLRLRLEYWRKAGPVLLLLAFAMLALVLVPGVGRQVNGSTRWLPMGVFYLQVSELAKLFLLIYLAGYLVRRGEEVRTSLQGFLKPMLLLALACVLLLLEPDFGATVVLLGTALAMMYLAGVRLWQFALLLLLTAAALATLAYVSPYRWARVVSFLNPWDDPFNSGFQLVQSLIAFGRGEWFGVGLGGSIQKLFYLPEAHTDFLFAVLAEELGLVGAGTVIVLFGVAVWRACLIGARAERNQRFFAAYLAYGLGLWLGLQAFTNIGVNMGVLPTKGLTLPLMSYGGSSMVVTCVVVALLLRIGRENRLVEEGVAVDGGREL